MESRQVFGFAFDPEYSEEEMARMDAHRCIEEADLCDFNNSWIWHVIAGLEIRGSNGSNCYHVFSFATGMLMG